MNFSEIANARQSCRSYDENRAVEEEKLQAVVEAARLAPSACNGQPYFLTICRGQTAKEVAKATMSMGMNRFASQAPIAIVISERPYLTAEATAQGLATCILGWLDDEKIRKICDLKEPVRLVITLGYAKAGDPLRTKKRKALEDLTAFR